MKLGTLSGEQLENLSNIKGLIDTIDANPEAPPLQLLIVDFIRTNIVFEYFCTPQSSNSFRRNSEDDVSLEFELLLAAGEALSASFQTEDLAEFVKGTILSLKKIKDDSEGNGSTVSFRVTRDFQGLQVGYDAIINQPSEEEAEAEEEAPAQPPDLESSDDPQEEEDVFDDFQSGYF